MTTRGKRAGQAAGVAVVLALSGACGGDGDVAQPLGVGPATSLAPTTVATDYHRHHKVFEVGTGLVDGTSPDGSAIYVGARDASSPPRGCDGDPEPQLFRVPLNGDPRQSVTGAAAPVRGTIVRGDNGRVVVMAGCEGFRPSSSRR